MYPFAKNNTLTCLAYLNKKPAKIKAWLGGKFLYPTGFRPLCLTAAKLIRLPGTVKGNFHDFFNIIFLLMVVLSKNLKRSVIPF